MKLQMYSYSKAGGIIVSIQLSVNKVWDDCPATLHECKDWQQAAVIAQGIADTTGMKVRMTLCKNSHITQLQVGYNNGHYFNRPWHVDAGVDLSPNPPGLIANDGN